MAQAENQPTVDPVTQSVIRAAVQNLIFRHVFDEQDREDLVQHLLLRVLAASKKYDPRRGRRAAFEHVVVRNGLANLIRGRMAELNRQRRTLSLSGDEAWEEILLGERSRRQSQKVLNLVDFLLDFAEVLADAPSIHREVAEKMKTATVTEAARQLGKPRTTVNSQLRQLQKRCEKANLKDYL